MNLNLYVTGIYVNLLNVTKGQEGLVEYGLKTEAIWWYANGQFGKVEVEREQASATFLEPATICNACIVVLNPKFAVLNGYFAFAHDPC